MDWLDVLDQSDRAFEEEDLGFFVARLKPRDHWRIVMPRLPRALYLDIETTGLSFEHNYVTVIGVLYEGTFHQWVWPQRLDGFQELLQVAQVVVTFNGARFDLPFLQARIPGIGQPRAHIDLLPLARAMGARGGQKSVEEQLRLRRASAVRSVDGAEAVTLWSRTLYGDASAYRKLLLYNQQDVVMLPRIASRVCEELAKDIAVRHPRPRARRPTAVSVGAKPFTHEQLSSEWRSRRATLGHLERLLAVRLGRPPVVVGIDLRGKSHNPTGWARCEGGSVDTRLVHEDDQILDLTRSARPDVVSIDAPLSLPRGRRTVTDDSPCREEGGIVRDIERVLWSRRIPVYPALIRHMQGLTERGIRLARQLDAFGISVIESYPGAAQDILGIPRKRVDTDLLRQGLEDFGFVLRGGESHDELDAVTSSLVGYFYLAHQHESIGSPDEGFLIVPTWNGGSWGPGPNTI
jgi:uncharacterized protein YprB with RNaseH-like and TPR domain/predicted nuclease with RNAse H fold